MVLKKHSNIFENSSVMRSLFLWKHGLFQDSLITRKFKRTGFIFVTLLMSRFFHFNVF